MQRTTVGISLLLFGIFPTVISGCAGSVPSAEFRKQLADSDRLCAADKVTVKLVASDDVAINEVSRLRLESLIMQTIKQRKRSAQCKSDEKRSFMVNTTITRYDEGNAFARTILAGLGQIHIDGDFVLSRLSAEGDSVAEFTLQKTFAWGGLYGAVTRIDDVEPAFAEGVAEAIVAQTTGKADLGSAEPMAPVTAAAGFQEGIQPAGECSDCDFRKQYLAGRDFSRANLAKANLDKAVVRGANFSGADLSEAVLTGVDGTKATFEKAGLSNADLSSANLKQANLSGANLAGASLRNANLREADLRMTRFHLADLRGADVTSAIRGIETKYVMGTSRMGLHDVEVEITCKDLDAMGAIIDETTKCRKGSN